MKRDSKSEPGFDPMLINMFTKGKHHNLDKMQKRQFKRLEKAVKVDRQPETLEMHILLYYYSRDIFAINLKKSLQCFRYHEILIDLQRHSVVPGMISETEAEKMNDLNRAKSDIHLINRTGANLVVVCGTL